MAGSKHFRFRFSDSPEYEYPDCRPRCGLAGRQKAECQAGAYGHNTAFVVWASRPGASSQLLSGWIIGNAQHRLCTLEPFESPLRASSVGLDMSDVMPKNLSVVAAHPEVNNVNMRNPGEVVLPELPKLHGVALQQLSREQPALNVFSSLHFRFRRESSLRRTEHTIFCHSTPIACHKYRPVRLLPAAQSLGLPKLSRTSCRPSL